MGNEGNSLLYFDWDVLPELLKNIFKIKLKSVTTFKNSRIFEYQLNNTKMTTINASELKATLKAKGVKVLRTLTYKGGVIVTVDAKYVTVCEEFFASNKIACVIPMNAPKPAKANVLGYKNAAEFTSLYQL